MGTTFALEDLLEEPTQPVGSSAFQTSIPVQRQPEFDAWTRQNKITDLDHPDSHYDYRGAFMAGVQPDPSSGHWPDTYKQPGHPTFSVESQYAKGRTDAGTWSGKTFVPPAIQNVAPPPPQASQGSTFDLEDLLAPEPRSTVVGPQFADLPEMTGARLLGRHPVREMIPPEEIARQEKLALMSTPERAAEFGKGMAEGAEGLLTFPVDALKPVLSASPEEEQNPLVRSFAAAKAGGPTKAPALPMPGTAAPTEGLDLASQVISGLNPEPLVRQIVHGAVTRDPHALGLAAGFELGGKALGAAKSAIGGALERGSLPQPTLPPQIATTADMTPEQRARVEAPAAPQTFELDDLLSDTPAAPEAPRGLREYLTRISDEAVQRGEKPLSPENIEQIVTGQRPARAEAAPEEGRRVESKGPPEGMPERRLGARRVAGEVPPEGRVDAAGRPVDAEGMPIRTARPEQTPSVSETVRQKPTVEAGFEDFAREYRQHFADMQKYGPNQVGSQVFAEKMAKMAEAHPDWAERVENEGAPTVREKPIVGTVAPGATVDETVATKEFNRNLRQTPGLRRNLNELFSESADHEVIPPDLASALAKNDHLGFDNARQAAAAILQYPDWRQRWDVDAEDMRKRGMSEKAIAAATELDKVATAWKNQTLRHFAPQGEAATPEIAGPTTPALGPEPPTLEQPKLLGGQLYHPENIETIRANQDAAAADRASFPMTADRVAGLAEVKGISVERAADNLKRGGYTVTPEMIEEARSLAMPTLERTPPTIEKSAREPVTREEKERARFKAAGGENPGLLEGIRRDTRENSGVITSKGWEPYKGTELAVASDGEGGYYVLTRSVDKHGETQDGMYYARGGKNDLTIRTFGVDKDIQRRPDLQWRKIDPATGQETPTAGPARETPTSVEPLRLGPGEPTLEQPKVAPKAKGETAPYRVWTPKTGFTEMPDAKPAKLSLPPGFEDMQFMVHKAVGQPGWSVTEASTGANVGLGKTRAAALEAATKALTTVGPEKTLKAIEQTTAKIKAGEAARTGEAAPETPPADPIEALRQHAQAIAVTEKAIEHGKGADGEPFTPEQLEGFKKDAADQRAQIEQKIEQHAEVHGLKEAEKLRGQIWNEIKNTEIETPKPPVKAINPKFKKLDNEALVARQVELEERIQKDQAVVNKGVTPWTREDPNLEPGLQGSIRSGTAWSKMAVYAKGRMNQSGRLLDEILAEVKDRKISDEDHTGLEEAARERAAMAAEESAKADAAAFDEHLADNPEAGFIIPAILNPKLLAEKLGVTGFLKKYFTSKGNLPEAAFEENRQRIADIGAQDAQIGYTLRDFRRAAKQAYGGRKLTKAELQDLDDALKGQVPPSAVHPALQPVIARMRRQIDRLSEELINIGAVEGPVAAAITDNLGVYATRAYRVFEDPKWAEKVSDPVKNKVKALLRSEYPNAAPEEIDGLLDELLYRGEDGPLSLIARGSTLGSKDLSILQKRKNIAPEIRALWGEYQDPLVSYARSMTKMGHLIANHQFLTEVRNQGLGDFFHEKPIVKGGQSYHTKFASEGSKVLEPLNGLYTTPEIARAFRDAFEPRNTSALMRGYMAVNGAVKYGKTVLSPLTHVRNVLGNVGFAVANGHWRAEKGIDAIRSVFADLGLGDTPARRAYLQKMRHLGVIQESARGGELESVINDVINPGRPVEETMLGARKGVSKLYGVEDDVWKIFAFENERARYASAQPHLAPGELDRKAATIVQNTYPTFSLVPRGIKALRRFPILGSFVSFPSEVFRTGYQTLKLATEELSNPETHRIGAERLAGITLAAVGVTGLALGVREMQGWTKDKEEALRRFMPPWSENSPLLILGSDGAKVRLIDLGYSDPYSPMRKPIIAMLRGKDWKGSLARGIVEAAAPFLSEEILAGALLDVSRNKTKTGGRVYNPEDDPSGQAVAIAEHVWRAVEPGGVSSARRIYKGITGEADEQGRVYDPAAEMAAVATGQRIMHLDIAQAARFKMRQRAAELKDTELRVTSLLAKSGAGKAATIGSEYRQMDTHRKNVWQELQQDIHAAGMLGLSEDQLAQVLVTGGFSKQAAGDVLSGGYRPYLPSREFLGDALSRIDPADEAASAEMVNRIDAIVKAAEESNP